MSYSEKLKDPRWQKKRLEIMQRDGFACKQCGDETSTLNVHHRYYIQGREPWQYPGALFRILVDLSMRANESGYPEERKEAVAS